MRVALISDLHGNEIALRAVLEDAERAGVDQLVCLGDVATLGPAPEAVIDLLRGLGCPCIMGNHDAFLLEPELIHTYSEAPFIIAAVDWCRETLSARALDFVRGFLPRLELALSPEARLFVFHGSPRSHMEDLLATTPAEALELALGEHRAEVMAGGHTHVQMLRQHRGTLLVNPGSVALPFREYVGGKQPTLLPQAEYAIVEAGGGGIEVRLKRVAVDHPAMRRAALASSNPLGKMLAAMYPAIS